MKKKLISEQMYIRLFELGLPIALIARILSVSNLLVNINFEKVSKIRDFEKKPLRLKETKLELFKMYAWFLAEPIEYEQYNQGSVVSIKKVLHEYLGLDACIAYCSATLRVVNNYNLPICADDIPRSFVAFIEQHAGNFQQKFSDGVYSSNEGEDFLYTCMVEMHHEKIPFPNEEDFKSTEQILQKTIKTMILDKGRAQVMLFVDELLNSSWDGLAMFRALDAIEKKFKNQKPITADDFELIPRKVNDVSKYLQTLVIPIEYLDLSVRAFNCLKALEANNLWQVVQLDKQELLHGKNKKRNFGKKTLQEIESLLEEKGLRFNMKLSEHFRSLLEKPLPRNGWWYS
jgi:hypothetical protein